MSFFNLKIRAIFTKGDSRTKSCQWYEDYPITSLFRLYPYEHQEKKPDFPYRAIGFDFNFTTHICIRKDIPVWQQAWLFFLYWVGVAIGYFRVVRRQGEYEL